MKKSFSWIAVLLMLSGWTATAQTLSIANTTPGYVALAFTNLSSSYALQTTTNLSHPTIWNVTDPLFNAISIPTVEPQRFFRLAPYVPVFQFAIFYNLNLEIDPGGAMPIIGPVFCNANIWSGTANVTYSSTVTAVGTNNISSVDPFLTTYAQSGTPAGNFSSQPVSGVGALNLLFGTNNMPNTAQSILQLQLPPSTYALGTAAAYSTNGQIYLCNTSDLIVSNSPNGTNSVSPSGTNLFVFFQDASAALYLAPVTPDFYKLKTGGSTNFVSTNLTAGKNSITNVQYASYSFLTNVLFYDWREGLPSGKAKAVQAVQIDIAKFNIWQTNTATNGGNLYNSKNILDKGHPIDSVYFYNAVPATSNNLPAVRVVNGQQLPSNTFGLTIATPFPMYVMGNYNVQWDATHQLLDTNSTVYTRPAALMADAITILSAGWNDAITTLKPNSATDTTVNAAMLEGIVPSNQSVDGISLPGGSGGGTYNGYSGGVENFLRLLEDWGGQTLTFNGSIVAMFPSQYATNYWNGDYYGVPTRHWAFDTNFRVIGKLPPLTPQVMNFVSP
jgi:hypothetical protein